MVLLEGGVMQKAIGYIRVSTTGQAEEGVSLAAQKEKITAWATLNDVELVAIHSDEGISGKSSENRKALQGAIEVACDLKAVLVVYSISRMSRRLAIAEHLEKAGADLVSLSEQIDTTSAAGKMVFRMMAVLAEFERDLVSERTKAALAHKRAKGQRVGNIAYGYWLAEDGEALEADDQEQGVLKSILRLRKRGYSLQKIADKLNSKGHRTRSGSEWKKQYIGNLVRSAA
jgi:DNA invertase Pin-like site-specific DNA recombinase